MADVRNARDDDPSMQRVAALCAVGRLRPLLIVAHTPTGPRGQVEANILLSSRADAIMLVEVMVPLLEELHQRLKRDWGETGNGTG